MLSNFYFYCAHCCLLLISVISFDPQKYKGMIEKVNITDANVVELIREKLPAATEANKGLMQANGFEQGKNILNEEYDSKISAGV